MILQRRRHIHCCIYFRVTTLLPYNGINQQVQKVGFLALSAAHHSTLACLLYNISISRVKYICQV